jgi:hypothetical protein
LSDDRDYLRRRIAGESKDALMQERMDKRAGKQTPAHAKARRNADQDGNA